MITAWKVSLYGVFVPNMKSIINTHKKTIINPPKNNITRRWNCIRKHQCPPMSYTKQVPHQTKEIWKQKFIMTLVKHHLSSDTRTIKKTFNNIKYQTDTELLNEYWNIILANKTSNISWEILGTHKSDNQSSKQCLLNEKLVIALHGDDNMLNKKSEVITKCRHRNKYERL